MKKCILLLIVSSVLLLNGCLMSDDTESRDIGEGSFSVDGYRASVYRINSRDVASNGIQLQFCSRSNMSLFITVDDHVLYSDGTYDIDDGLRSCSVSKLDSNGNSVYDAYMHRATDPGSYFSITSSGNEYDIDFYIYVGEGASPSTTEVLTGSYTGKIES